MASQPVMEAAARESRANAREDMAVLTSGAREKVDSAMASTQAFGQTLLHPMDKTKKEEAQAAAEQRKKEAMEKRDEIRSIAAQQGATERAAARSMVAKGLAEAGGTRYPVLTTTDPQQQPASTDVSYSPNQQATPIVPHTDIPDYHPPHPSTPATTERTQPPLHDHSSADSKNGSTPLEAIHVERTHDQRPVVGGADTCTKAPVPVAPPSRQDASMEQDRQGEKVEEGVEDADFYPPTRIVQT